MLSPIFAALTRARGGILVVALIHVLGVGTGMAMVHSGNRFALNYRDSLVARAHRNDPASQADDAGSHMKAAAWDFSRNLGLVAIPETIGGLTFVLPAALAAHRAWVGGIVSVDRAHRSRLQTPSSAVYYLVTLIVQLAAFTLACGAGLHLGWDFFHKRGPFVGPSWFRLPRPALRDVAWIYVLVVPLFAAGSIWEFLYQVP